MGGYGAAKLALSRPDIFSHGAAFSGAMDMELMRKERLAENEGEQHNVFWQSIFGPNGKELEDKDDLLKLAEKCKAEGKMPKIYQWCGTEDFLYKYNLTFRDRLTELGFDLTYSESPGGHTWDHWDAQIQKALEWLPLKKAE
jgi:S-formylglutathione hydrolase FrmB